MKKINFTNRIINNNGNFKPSSSGADNGEEREKKTKII